MRIQYLINFLWIAQAFGFHFSVQKNVKYQLHRCYDSSSPSVDHGEESILERLLQFIFEAIPSALTPLTVKVCKYFFPILNFNL